MVSVKTITLVGLALFASRALANIKIPLPTIKCGKDTPENLCLRGQHCDYDQGICVVTKYERLRSRGLVTYSTDGRCGPQFGGRLCDPKAKRPTSAYQGTCCSAHGWCGDSAAHCGSGCISGCTPSNTYNTKTSERKKAPEKPIAESANNEPVIKPAPAGGISASAPGDPTTDGTCGSTNGGTTCVGWPNGGCCSMYGFCGNTAAHCGEGCQSGPCTGVPEAPGPRPAPLAPNGGRFTVIGRSGVPAMHAGLLPNGRVVFLDKIEDYTEVRLSNGRYAYSSEFNPADNKVVGLAYKTNAFCAGGTFLANGDFISVGGNGPLDWLDPTVGDGFRAIRYLSRSSTNAGLNGQAWREPGNTLTTPRWYPSVQTLANGKVFVVSGSKNGLDPTKPENNNPTYEILTATGERDRGTTSMDILVRNQPYYMYPFMHLLRSGLIFVFTSKSSQVFDINANRVSKSLPDIPGDYRTYPNTGGSVLLPLSSKNNWASSIMICGGGAYQDISSPTEPSCGVIRPEDSTPTWEMDAMPEGRGMVEAILLPDGKVLWLNGANRGAQGFLLADAPTRQALLYTPWRALGQRWERLAESNIPRLYHSVALLLLDGTVLVSGSNPNEMPVLQPRAGNPYITEFSVERYTPPYLMGTNASRRPTNMVLPNKVLTNDQLFEVRFNCLPSAKDVQIVLYHGGFVTHSVHMGHRMMVLNRRDFKPGQAAQVVTARMPPNKNIAPPGPYVIYAVVDGIPSVGQFVQVV